MEKIQLTQEQADRIDFLLNQWMPFNGDAVEEALLKVHLDNWRDENNRCLNELSLDSMARVLYTPNSYEVIPRFNVGDWATRTVDNGGFLNEGRVFKIAKISGGHAWEGEANDSPAHLFENIRHSTSDEIQQEKERRWWAKHDREVWELREGDTLKDEINYPHFVTRGNRTDQGLERTPSLNCIFKDMEGIKRRFKVACFSEDRLDK
ncbi:hypothetical protein [Oceanobacillus oncorhynchi]|uniref:hypothetical protein n=1 Tax=Oceanobacillus oncorhynchi TaxID=545501 RepID=UPI0018689708|nr:hypothetical protein [Oceanobacillus oncorhynchi]